MPWYVIALAYLGGIGWLLAFIRRHKKLHLLTAVIWIAYAVYETLIATRVLCEDGCNIRVDLLLILPLLAILFVTSLVVLIRSK